MITIFKLIRIDKAVVGPHVATLVHCKVNGFTGYLVLPNTDIDKVTAAFSIIDTKEVEDKNETDNDGPRRKGASKRTDTIRDEGGVGVENNNVISAECNPSRDSIPGGPGVEPKTRRRSRSVPVRKDGLVPSSAPHGSDNVPKDDRDIAVVVKRTRRTRKEMEALRAKAGVNTANR